MGQKLHLYCAVGILFFALPATTARGEDEAPPDLPNFEVRVPLAIDSGPLRADDRGEVLLLRFQTIVRVAGADSVRLSLTGTELAAPAAQLLITSLLDGATQMHNAATLAEWRATSAYFNGDAVLVQLFAPGDEATHRILIDAARVEFPGGDDRSICGANDERVLSGDPTSGRLLPIGCTGWLINGRSNAGMTAGHCTDGIEVMQFHVPLSTSNGTKVHPGPEHQYAVQQNSIVMNSSPTEIGNDWAVFGMFNNSVTGLPPAEAQGATVPLQPVIGTGSNTPAMIRISGYGTRAEPNPRTWNQVLTTHAGPYITRQTYRLRYRAHTTGGNSGSAVWDDDRGWAIGVHTNAGCTATNATSSNSGTAIDHPSIVQALSNPVGLAGPRALRLMLSPHHPPAALSPRSAKVNATLAPDYGNLPAAGSGTLHYSTNGGSFAEVPLADLGWTLHRGTLPPLPCLAQLNYYLRAEDMDGRAVTLPPGAPLHTFEAVVATGFAPVVSYDFEEAAGWTVVNTALAAGAWERGTPVTYTVGYGQPPPHDFDGSGQCWLTDNRNAESDVDGGPTTLYSPVFDLSTLVDPRVRYARWFASEFGRTDRMHVEISSNGGATWSTLEDIRHTPAWVVSEFRLRDFVPLTSAVQFRFAVADSPNDSMTEAALDAFALLDAVCTPLAGDFDGDGVLTGADFVVLLACFTGPDVLTGAEDGGCAAVFDFDQDGDIDLHDVAALQHRM